MFLTRYFRIVVIARVYIRRSNRVPPLVAAARQLYKRRAAPRRRRKSCASRTGYILVYIPIPIIYEKILVCASPRCAVRCVYFYLRFSYDLMIEYMRLYFLNINFSLHFVTWFFSILYLYISRHFARHITPHLSVILYGFRAQSHNYTTV